MPEQGISLELDSCTEYLWLVDGMAAEPKASLPPDPNNGCEALRMALQPLQYMGKERQDVQHGLAACCQGHTQGKGTESAPA